MARSKLAASQRGVVPKIVCVNRATADLGVGFRQLVSALQVFVDEHLVPVWGTGAKLVTARDPIKEAWTLVFLDTAKDVKLIPLKGIDRKKVMGQHKLERHKLPLAMVFVESTLAANSKLRRCDKISVAASHELAEMLVDPGNNLWCEASKGTFYGYEVCDPVEDRHFTVKGLLMSNFVHPAYFDVFRKPKSAWFDHMGIIDRPFQILSDGYIPIKKNGELSLKRGSKAKGRQLAAEDRKLHRSEFRKERGTIRVRIIP